MATNDADRRKALAELLARALEDAREQMLVPPHVHLRTRIEAFAFGAFYMLGSVRQLSRRYGGRNVVRAMGDIVLERLAPQVEA